MSEVKTIGSKAEVMHGTALKTSGGLRLEDLMRNKNGRIVSKKKHRLGLIAFQRNKLKPKTKEELAALRNNARSGPSSAASEELP